jgi:hypothetical protein
MFPNFVVNSSWVKWGFIFIIVFIRPDYNDETGSKKKDDGINELSAY